jgi:hypothetical protein
MARCCQPRSTGHRAESRHSEQTYSLTRAGGQAVRIHSGSSVDLIKKDRYRTPVVGPTIDSTNAHVQCG